MNNRYEFNIERARFLTRLPYSTYSLDLTPESCECIHTDNESSRYAYSNLKSDLILWHHPDS